MSYRRTLGAVPAPSPVPVDKIAAGAMVYHGYRRTGSLLWALFYGLAGYKVPVVAVPVAIAQGFGKKKTCTVE